MSTLQLWRRYSREQIPGLFGFPFSDAIWNAGFVVRPGHIFLLVTLDKKRQELRLPVPRPLPLPHRLSVGKPEPHRAGTALTAA